MRKRLVFILVAIALLSVLLGGCAPPPIVLDGVEVKEYQGQNLSSIQDFRENSIRGPQHVDIKTYQLRVDGLVASPRIYSYEDVINDNQHYKKVVTLNCVEGWSVDILWEGMLVEDIIAEAKPSPDAKIIIFHAYDGYTSSLPLDFIKNNKIMIAYRMNEVTMPPERGYPFHLVAESRWGYKWVKWITEIELSDDMNYRGYWESEGYSNIGEAGGAYSGD